ncbi:MAG: hypothetical protein HYZ58_16720 [Acidobacteria bacterium]|nr:hypothetical protein [Acidobacteriota bacterium]
MQQRQLRLGDVLDDYCPRERRITDHAIVAMVGAVVKQTRCTTCEAEHDYKHAKAPTLRRRKDAPPAALFSDVVAGMPEAKAAPTAAQPPAPAPPLAAGPQESSMTHRSEDVPDSVPPEPAPASVEPEAAPSAAPEEEGPVHRRLIRATLPRQEGQPPARPLPDFTVRRPGIRQGGGYPPSFRDRDRGSPQGHRNPNGASRGGGFGRSAGPKSDFGHPGRGDSRLGRRGHGSRRGGKKH